MPAVEMKWFVKYTLTSELLIVESHVETANFECKEEFGASNVGSSFMSETPTRGKVCNLRHPEAFV
jgi:hypothetical protein